MEVKVLNPLSVCCDESLMVCAMRTVGVGAHPLFKFSNTVEEIEGAPVVTWRWVLAAKSADGVYKTRELMKWFMDEAWMKANPRHEFAVVSRVVRNMGVHAAEVRGRVQRAVVRHGRDKAYIPVNASPARREWLLARLEGRIPMATAFEDFEQTFSDGPIL